MEKKNKKEKYDMVNVFFIGFFIGMVILTISNVILSEYMIKEQNSCKREYLDTIKINGIEDGKKNIESYICTSGVRVEDYRGKCGDYDCNIWFKGEGECAYTYKE